MLEQVIREARTEVIYASAPAPVLREVTILASRYDIPVQAQVNVAMTCGIGLCMGCVLPVTGTDGITRIVRACVDGPVFRADLVRWDDIGTIPFDAVGAPGWPRARGSGGSGEARGPGESEESGESRRNRGARGVRGDGQSPRDRGVIRGVVPPGQQSNAG